MKAVLIIYNQAHTEKVEYMLDRMGIRGFSKWEEVFGRGTLKGEPRLGTHTWPEVNSATLTVVEEERVDEILANVKKIDRINEEVGIKTFVWEVERML